MDPEKHMETWNRDQDVFEYVLNLLVYSSRLCVEYRSMPCFKRPSESNMDIATRVIPYFLNARSSHTEQNRID